MTKIVCYAVISATVLLLIAASNGFKCPRGVLISSYILGCLAILVLIFHGYLVYLKLIWLRSEGRDFSSAKRATGSEGAVYRDASMVIWHNTIEQERQPVLDAFSPTIEKWTELTGLPVQLRAPLRVLFFRNQTEIQRYTRAIFGRDSRSSGYYLAWPTPRIVFSKMRGENGIAQTFAHELTHHLAQVSIGRQPPLWLNEGLAQLISTTVDNTPTCPGAASRWVAALRDANRLLSGEKLTAISYHHLHSLLAGELDAARLIRVLSIYIQSSILVRHLILHPDDQFKKYMQSMATQKDRVKALVSAFGQDPDELMKTCADKMLEKKSDYTAPPKWLKVRYEQEIIPIIKEKEADPLDRINAIASLMRHGWVWGARFIVEALQDDNPHISEYADWSLQLLAGGNIGDKDHGRWSVWVDSLPDDAVAPYVLR